MAAVSRPNNLVQILLHFNQSTIGVADFPAALGSSGQEKQEISPFSTVTLHWGIGLCCNNNLKSPILISLIKFVLAKYYKDSEMTAYISERSRNLK